MILNNWKSILFIDRIRNNSNRNSIPCPRMDIWFSNGQTWDHNVTSFLGTWAINTTDAHNSLLNTTFYPCIGTGTTVESPSDYQLNNDITSQISNLTYAKTVSTDEDYNLVTTYVITGINNSGSEQTITEAGFYVQYQAGSSSAYYMRIYIVRKLLDTPIVVPAGGGFKITLDMVENVTG